MPSQKVLFKGLTPDQPDVLNGGLEDAVNCIPFEQSYGPLNGPAVYSASLSGTCIGAASMKSIAGNAITFAGTQGSLWKESAAAVNNVSRTASYTTAVDGRWEFENFGNTAMTVNGIDPMQIWTLDTSTRWRDQSASASAPIAYTIANIRDFVVVARIANAENRVQWCQINNPLRWTTSVQLQADFQDLPGNSTCRDITGGDFGAVLTENSVWRMSYVGSPLIFRFDEMSPGIGTTTPGTCVRWQNVTFFYSQRGFMAFDGEQAHPIGEGYIDSFFREDFSSAYRYAVSAVIDPVNKLYIVAYPSVEGSGVSNRWMIYSWPHKKWARAEVDLDYLFNALSGGYTLEGLDAVMPDIDAGVISLDSDAWKGGLVSLAGFDTGHRLVKFDASPLTARFLTGEAQIITDRRAFVRAVWPLVEGDASTAVTAYLGSRSRLIESVSWTSAVSMNSIGFCPFRNDSRYQRFRLDVAGGFDRAMGGNVEYEQSGMR